MGPKEIYFSRPWLKSYNEWTPTEIHGTSNSIGQCFDEATDKWRDKVAIEFYGRKMKYGELREHVDRLAVSLDSLGIRKGDTIALLLLNSPQFIITFYAALKLGAIVTPISPVYVTPEIKYQLEDSEAKDIVCLDVLWDKVEKSGVKLRNVILTNIGEYLTPAKRFLGHSILSNIYKRIELPSPKIYQQAGFYQFQDLLKRDVKPIPNINIQPQDDIAALLYTGGTTGWPKAAMVTHFSLLVNNEQTKAFWGPVFIDGKSVMSAFAPFYHIAGLSSMVLTAILRGYTIIVFTTPDVDAILESIELDKVTALFSVPSFWEMLRDYQKTMRVNWKRLNVIITGADTLLEETAKGWERRTGTQLHEAYGLSECSPMTHYSPYGKVKVGSFGVPLPSTLAVVLDPEKDDFIPVGKVGELAISGPQLFKGYWKRPDETAMQCLNIDGRVWFRTGDLVYMDEDGYFFFYDRKKDIIKYKGYQVYARMVEEIIKTHPKVKEVGVIGVPDPSVGQQIKAYVVLQADGRGKVTESDIADWCKDKIAYYMIPKVVEFRGEIPKTDIGKVSRRDLREELLEQ